MSRQLPHFSPVTMNGLVYREARTLSEMERISSATLQTRAIAAAPAELHCNTPDRTDFSRQGRGSVFDLTYKEMLGDHPPLNFATFDGDECVDAFGFYAIKSLVNDRTGIQVSARAFPAFLNLIKSRDHTAYAEAVADFYGFMADTTFQMVDGRTFEVFTVVTVNHFLTVGTEGRTDADVRVQACVEEVQRRAALPDPPQKFNRITYEEKGEGDWTVLTIENSSRVLRRESR